MTIEDGETKCNDGDKQRELVVFDFDETIVDCNSDTHINVLAPNGTIPSDLWKKDYENDWTDYMQQVFIYLHQNGVQKSDYELCLKTVPFVSGFEELLRNLAKGTHEKIFDVIIISDANHFFIKNILLHQKLLDCFKEIFTNSAHFDESGCLRIGRFHEQNWCQLSARNLCKGHVLKDFIAKQALENKIHYDRISYVGDGSNDLCPSLKLTTKDYVFPRLGYRLYKLTLEKIETKEMNAKCVPFVTGNDIWNVISKT